MTWLALWFSLQVGVAPLSGVITYPGGVVPLSQFSGYIQMTSEVRMLDDHTFIGGFVRTEIQPRAFGIGFVPELMTYGFNAGLRYNGIEFGGFADRKSVV